MKKEEHNIDKIEEKIKNNAKKEKLKRSKSDANFLGAKDF